MMRILREGASGQDVTRWQMYLIGLCALHDEADGSFGPATTQATRDFQRLCGLKPDGIVGDETLGEALRRGYPLVDLTDNDKALEDGPEWPPRPDFNPLCLTDRQRIFGKFMYVAAPTPTNPEGIQIIDNWASENIVTIEIPQIVGKTGAPHDGKVQVHKLVAGQVQAVFQAWQDAGLLDYVLSWAGSWAPRFVRGSRVNLSNHSWATAFDINAGWNPLGSRPALKGKPGSVRELVRIANETGFFWGGHFGYYTGGRSDGMHFEIAQVRK